MLSEHDTHVGSASEDGNVYFWDLVEVSSGGEPPPRCKAAPPQVWGSPPALPVTPPQGSLALKLAVGRGVVQSLAFHPALPCLLTAADGCVQLWREDGFQPEGEGDADT